MNTLYTYIKTYTAYKKIKKVIIFGDKDLAQLAKFYLENDPEYKSNYLVSGFTVDDDFYTTDSYEGLPVVPFSKLEKTFPPAEYYLFAPMTGRRANKVREDVYQKGLSYGYKYISYISSSANVLSKHIGENCFILEDNTIQPFVTIGNNVVMWSGNHIGHHSKIGDNVFFTSHVCLSGHCIVENNCWFGVNATIRDGLVIKQGSLIAMSSSILKNTEEWGVYIGSPANKKENMLSYEVL
jgi:sugar O-acyltransferase (sialic acid O-acetyltransferase NeuD family)